MAKKISPLLPSADELLQQFGERLRLARLRRGLSAKQVCERAGMAPMTLRSLERGASGVTIGAYLAVMQVLGIEQDLKLLGQVDTMGRSLQDARLPAPRMAAKRPNVQRKASPHNDADEPLADSGKALETDHAEMLRLAAGSNTADDMHKAQEVGITKNLPTDWANDGEFISSSELSNLLTPSKKEK
jgi:transcriptional regulator with XRE-family HTH domain